jgi:hypothetical protein
MKEHTSKGVKDRYGILISIDLVSIFLENAPY